MNLKFELWEARLCSSLSVPSVTRQLLPGTHHFPSSSSVLICTFRPPNFQGSTLHGNLDLAALGPGLIFCRPELVIEMDGRPFPAQAHLLESARGERESLFFSRHPLPREG